MNTQVIYIALHSNQSLISDFEITKETEKAYQIKNNSNKTMWIPKKGLELHRFSTDSSTYYQVANWFRRKLENWQVSFLQC